MVDEGARDHGTEHPIGRREDSSRNEGERAKELEKARNTQHLRFEVKGP